MGFATGWVMYLFYGTVSASGIKFSVRSCRMIVNGE